MKKYILLFTFITLISLSCSKDSVKPSEDSILANAALSSIGEIKTAYENRNWTVLRNRVAPELAEKIIKGSDFMKAELSMTPRVVKISDSSITVNINWNGTWWPAKDRKLENGGAADLVLNREKMMLIKVEGVNPFSIPLGRSY